MCHQKHMPMLFIAGLVLAFLISGCAFRTGYGKFRLHPRDGLQVNIRDLQETWKDHTIYCAELSVGTPGGVMSDPKNDNRTLTGDRSNRVKDENTLSELIRWMEP